LRKRTLLAAVGGGLLAAAIGIFGVPAVASASTPSPVVGYTYIDGNTAKAIPSTGTPGTRTARSPR
jgi:hypothetical protein